MQVVFLAQRRDLVGEGVARVAQATFALDGFHDEIRYVVGVDRAPVGVEQPTESRALPREKATRARLGGTGPVVTERDVVNLADLGELASVDRLRAVERERAQRPAVEGPLEGDPVVAARVVVGYLDGVLDRLGARIGEKDRVESVVTRPVD
jgi:hypothetical protein